MKYFFAVMNADEFDLFVAALPAHARFQLEGALEEYPHHLYFPAIELLVARGASV